jgi:hypothetical protein
MIFKMSVIFISNFKILAKKPTSIFIASVPKKLFHNALTEHFN